MNNYFDIDGGIGKFLRNGQKKGIEKAFEYIKNAPKGRSCLINLPTGAGKTGVIAVISHFSPHKKILLLCHRKAVREQLKKEVSGGFFTEKCPGEKIKLKKVSSDFGLELIDGIYVSTFQKLSRLNQDELLKIKSTIDLVIVDEGHSEPAPVWSKITRNLDAHKIIITATPYRNDLFQFDIAPEWSVLYTFKHALSDGIICNPKFENIGHDQLISRVATLLRDQPGIKCIVKCKSFEAVKEYKDIFSSSGFNVLAIHERFEKGGQAEKATVPANLKDLNVDIIIHQYKLDEGIDIPQAKVLVLTYAVSSGRELVQAVGRIVRKCEHQVATVLDVSGGSNAKMWSNYIDFDEYISSEGEAKKFLHSLDTARLLSRYLEAFPDVSYFESSYRKKFDIVDFDPEHDLTVPLASVCFIQKMPNFSMASLLDTIYWKLTRDGELVEIKPEKFGINTIVSVSFDNSKFLRNLLFFQPTLQIILVKDVGNIVAIYDSRGIDYSSETELGLGLTISTDQILALTNRSAELKTKQATAFSIGSNKRRPEGISFKGENLELMGAAQSNSSYALSTLIVDNFNPEGHREYGFYLGVGTGRVSDQKKRKFTLDSLSCWMTDVAEVVSNPTATNSVLLNSFAQPVKTVPTEKPLSVLLDLTELNNAIEINFKNSNHVLNPDFYYFTCIDSGFFLFENGPKIKVDYNQESGCPEFIESDVTDGSKSNFTIESPQRISGDKFLEEMNKLPIKILYEGSLTFAYGNFYRFKLPTEYGLSIEQTPLGVAIIGIGELQKEGLSEKGKTGVYPDSFPTDSMFFLVDKMREINSSTALVGDLGPFYQFLPDVDLIVCTDMGTEAADFILSSPSKLIYVHMKCGTAEKKPMSSAGAIAEVGGQAIKNLEMLITPNVDLKPGNWSMLAKPWPAKNPDGKHLNNRVRLIDKKTSEKFASDNKINIRDIIDHAWEVVVARRRSKAIEKEIWIAVGNGFSRSHFIEQIKIGNDGNAESLQAFQLLDAWRSAAFSQDVNLRFFVSP